MKGCRVAEERHDCRGVSVCLLVREDVVEGILVVSKYTPDKFGKARTLYPHPVSKV